MIIYNMERNWFLIFVYNSILAKCLKWFIVSTGVKGLAMESYFGPKFSANSEAKPTGEELLSSSDY